MDRRALSTALLALAAACGGDLQPAVLGDAASQDAATQRDAGATDAASDTREPDVEAGTTPRRARSCTPPSPGAGPNCGTSHADDCCASDVVPGGRFVRFYDGVFNTDMTYAASVSAFGLDRYELTVGRFRAFVDAFPGSHPNKGDGAHPRIAGSGWMATWPLAADKATLLQQLDDTNICPKHNWTDAAGAAENDPINCLTWYEVFAFCAWDNGRLPTEAEWNFAASGGGDQRVYPWSAPPSSATVDDLHVVYSPVPGALMGPLAVGQKPAGVSRWGQFDLAGNMAEQLFDAFAMGQAPMPCADCANASNDPTRVVRGGSWDDGAVPARSSERDGKDATARFRWAGGRCARDLQ